MLNKWSRAEMAIKSGVDVVIELPTIFSTSSAENFAEGAIKIFNELKIVDTLVFGTETKDTAALTNIASILYSEPKEFKIILEKELSKGNSFPVAREHALNQYLGADKMYGNIIKTPNNILAIEYLKALYRERSDIESLPIPRRKVMYHDDEVNEEFASATGIRKLVLEGNYSEIKRVVPKTTYDILARDIKAGNIVLSLSRFEKEILYKLRTMSIEEIKELPDVSEGLENAIKQAANSCNNMNDLLKLLDTKRYTQTRIKRILLYALLGIDKRQMSEAKRFLSPYVRLLGCSEVGKEMVSDICHINPRINLVSSVKKFMDDNKNKGLKELLEQDIMATNIYTLGYRKTSIANLDYTSKIVVIN